MLKTKIRLADGWQNLFRDCPLNGNIKDDYEIEIDCDQICLLELIATFIEKHYA